MAQYTKKLNLNNEVVNKTTSFNVDEVDKLCLINKIFCKISSLAEENQKPLKEWFHKINEQFGDIETNCSKIKALKNAVKYSIKAGKAEELIKILGNKADDFISASITTSVRGSSKQEISETQFNDCVSEIKKSLFG